MENFWVVDCIQSDGKTCQMICPGNWPRENVERSTDSYIEEKMRYKEYITRYSLSQQMLTSEQAQHIEDNEWV